ncbi:MAG: hypothetical protein RBR78_09515 [Flavobacteriaceae bacterium]|nr:hypothetical protein [Flavobacteriaceae bacterium]
MDFFNEEYFQIEIKPTVSDDFPSVLRQMKASMPVKGYINSILFLKEYTGIGATKEEFCNYFKSQGYLVVFENEIDNIDFPNFDQKLIAEQNLRDKVTEILK